MTSRLPILLGAALLGAVLVIGIALGLGLVPLDTSGGLSAEVNVLVNEAAPIDANNSPAIARNPLDVDQVALVHRVDRPGFDARLHISADGGRTWEERDLPLPDGLDRPFAPDVAFGPDGRLHVSYVNLTGPGNRPENLWLATSEDGGRTLSGPVRVIEENTFQARLAVGGDGVIHLTWLRPSQIGLLSLPGPAGIVATHSHDGGRTFGEAVVVSDPDERPRVGAAVPVVDQNDNPLIVYMDFGEDVIDYEGIAEADVFEGTFTILLARSPDGGDSFADSVEIDDQLVPTERFLAFLPPFPDVAVGADNAIHVVWSDGRDGSQDVRLARSTDWGSSWTEPVVVNGNPADDGTAQLLPQVDVAGSGRVDVLYLDRRDDPDDVATTTTLSSSADGGRTFSSVTVADQLSDARVGSSAAPFLPVDIGSRIALSSTDQEVLAAWVDTRFGTEVDGRQDIVSAVVARDDDVGLTEILLVAGILAVIGVATWRRARTSATRTA